MVVMFIGPPRNGLEVGVEMSIPIIFITESGDRIGTLPQRMHFSDALNHKKSKKERKNTANYELLRREKIERNEQD